MKLNSEEIRMLATQLQFLLIEYDPVSLVIEQDLDSIRFRGLTPGGATFNKHVRIETLRTEGKE